MGSLTFTTQLTLLECAECHIPFGITPFFEQNRRRDHKSFYCPSGHSNYYPQESDIQKAQREAREANQRARYAYEERDREAKAAQDARNRARAEKAAKTRLKNRIAKGVCPCCTRYFSNVHEHISKEHPEFVVPE